jgi:AcrR family transcriptional regulator
VARGSVDGAGDEFARIRAALVELVAARGYQLTTVDHVIELAGVEPAAFHRHFASVEECFAATWEAVDGELTGLMASAFGRRATWRDRLRDALLAGLGYLAEDDSRARLYVAEVVYVSEEMRDRQRRSLARLSATIDLGRGGEDGEGSEEQVSSEIADAVSGAIWHRTHQLIQTGRGKDLPAQLRRFMYIAVLPYRGADAAKAELGDS